MTGNPAIVVDEIKVLAEKVNAGDASATREMLALVEDLGLRDGTPGATERRQLVIHALGDDSAAIHALETAGKPEGAVAARTLASSKIRRGSRLVRTARHATGSG